MKTLLVVTSIISSLSIQAASQKSILIDEIYPASEVETGMELIRNQPYQKMGISKEDSKKVISQSEEMTIKGMTELRKKLSSNFTKTELQDIVELKKNGSLAKALNFDVWKANKEEMRAYTTNTKIEDLDKTKRERFKEYEEVLRYSENMIAMQKLQFIMMKKAFSVRSNISQTTINNMTKQMILTQKTIPYKFYEEYEKNNKFGVKLLKENKTYRKYATLIRKTMAASTIKYNQVLAKYIKFK